MEEFQVNALLKNAQMKIADGRFDEAEAIYDRLIGTEYTGWGWTFVGISQLLKLRSRFPDLCQYTNGIIDKAFKCFREAKSCFSDVNEFEVTVVRESYDTIKKLGEGILSSTEDSKTNNNFGKILIEQFLSGMVASSLTGNHAYQSQWFGASLFRHTLNSQNQQNLVNNLLAAINILKAYTVDFIEYQYQLKEEFINHVDEMVNKLQWYLLPEKEKRKLGRA